jgi:dethiobiotin synthetase/adenosylmethionine--8-amino-7-oxononanoate aminotransferase
MRLPVILVGDHRLGGIASTISAAESLLMRGYDIDAVVCFNDQEKYENSKYLLGHFKERNIAGFELPWIPSLERCTEEEEIDKMKEYYASHANGGKMKKLASHLVQRHGRRIAELQTMASRTAKSIWHPFTQHKSVKSPDDVLVFDSAYGDYFQTLHTHKPLQAADKTNERPILYPAFDGSASWWTQGLGHGNPRLSLAAAYAAGRYGHVMFAGATHEPALTLAERLLAGLGNPRLTKVFYSDNGSTAVEVGIKMALRATCMRYDWDGSSEEIGVLGLKGSYHGDTIGAMDASEPCVYNKKVDWYRGRGYWFDFPTVKMQGGKWIVEPPANMEDEIGHTQYFDSLDDIFNFQARGPQQTYEQYIRKTLDRLVKTEGRKFGALVMEPIILGAGGMLFMLVSPLFIVYHHWPDAHNLHSDPLFQRTIVTVVRSYSFSASYTSTVSSDPHGWTGLPVVFDEVFTGLYRLGHFSASSLLRTHADISVHAKLLTGGLLPLSTTLASDSIFAAFYSDEKSDALLHGHSYTAHPVGCHVANTSLSAMGEIADGAEWNEYRESWILDESLSAKLQETEFGAPRISGPSIIWSMWSKPTVTTLSHHPKVDSVIALGSVLAVTLKDPRGAGYTSNVALGLRDALLNQHGVGQDSVSIHSRVLGNVLYLMASMTTKPEHLKAVERVLLQKLEVPA